MLIDFGALLPVEVVIDGVVRCDRKALQNRLRDFAQAGEATRNNVAGEWVSNLIRVSIGTNDIVNRKRIVDLSLIDRTAGRVSHRLAIDSQLWSERLRKVSTPVRRGERGERCVVRTRTVFEACVVHKEESLIATVVELGKAHRAAEGSAKLVLLERRLLVCLGAARSPRGDARRVLIVGDVAGCVESVVLQKVECATVPVIRARIECEGDDAAGEAVLCGLVAVDELELADGIDGGMIQTDVAGEAGVHNWNAIDVDLIGVANRSTDVKAIVRRSP